MKIVFGHIDLIQDWKNKVLTSEGRSIPQEIESKISEVDSKVSTTQTRNSQLSDLSSRVAEISNGIENRRASVQSMCEVWFCEILSAKHKSIRRSICDNPNFSDDNFLCAGIDAKIPEQGSEAGWSDIFGDNTGKRIDNICHENGFSNQYIVENMRPSLAAQCFGNSNKQVGESYDGQNSQTGPQNELTLTWYTDLFGGDRDRVYVALVKETVGQDTFEHLYRLDGCSKDQSIKLLNLPLDYTVEEQSYSWFSFFWDGINSSPFISCRDDLVDLVNPSHKVIDEPNIPTDKRALFFRDFSNNKTTYYIPGDEDDLFYSLPANCSELKVHLGLFNPVRKFVQIHSPPNGEIKPIICGTGPGAGSYEEVIANAGSQWKLWKIDPDSGWDLDSSLFASQLNDNCQAGITESRVGAYVLHYRAVASEDDIYLPIVKMDGCFLNDFTLYEHLNQGVPTFPLREKILRDLVGLSTDQVTQTFPSSLRSKLEDSPFLEFCSDELTCGSGVRRYYSELVNGNRTLIPFADLGSADPTIQSFGRDLDELGNLRQTWKFTADNTPSGAKSRLIFGSCNKDLMEAFGFGVPLNAIEDEEWYSIFETHRSDKLTSAKYTGFDKSLPCFERKTCTIHIDSEQDLYLASSPSGSCPVDTLDTTSYLDDVLEIIVDGNIEVNNTVVFADRDDLVDEGITPPARLSSFDSIIIRSSGSYEITSATSFNQDGNALWNKFKLGKRYRKSPLIAFKGLENGVSISDLTLRPNGSQGVTGIFSYDSKISLYKTNVGTSSNRFERAYYGRNASELYVNDTDFFSTGVAVSINRSRLSGFEKTTIDAEGKGIHLSTNSEAFVFDANIKGKPPIGHRGNNGSGQKNPTRLRTY